jgi:hypothetical protein
MMVWWIASLAAVALVIVPQEALAWGPVTHLVHGSEILAKLNTLSPALQELLGTNGLAYLYGCVGADITVAKRYTRSLYSHCHHWDVGFKLLDAARTDEEQAFAYGYLSHLASDVFSHNHYVPVQLIVSFPARTLRHVYWEARFDALQDRRKWALMKRVLSRLYPDCDALVEREVERTLFSFRTNKRIFNSVMALHQWDQWYRMMRRVSTRSRYPLPSSTAAEYNERCVGAIETLLTAGREAPCVGLDPTGHDTLARATHLRRKLRTLRRRGSINERLQQELASLAPPAISV